MAVTGHQLLLTTNQNQVKVTLRPMSLGVESPLGLKTRFLLLSDSCSFVGVSRGALTHEIMGLSFIVVTVSGTRFLYLRYSCR
jgi:hypothetical protein